MLLIHGVVISSSIEQIVGGISTDRIFEHGGVHLGHTAIVKFVPLVCGWILTIRSIMPKAHIAVVIGNGIKIIDQFLTICRSNNMRRQIKTLQRERHIRVNFLPIAAAAAEHHVSARLAALLKPLKVNNKDWRRLKNFELLLSTYVLLALIAVPHVVLVEDLSLFELVEAVFDGD